MEGGGRKCVGAEGIYLLRWRHNVEILELDNELRFEEIISHNLWRSFICAIWLHDLREDDETGRNASPITMSGYDSVYSQWFFPIFYSIVARCSGFSQQIHIFFTLGSTVWAGKQA